MVTDSQDAVIIHVIAGPTASGKSALALSKAQATDGVIINADSMQVYDALPLLTAQPPDEDKQKAPHMLYGVQHPNKWCSAGNWREMAMDAINDVLAQDKTPIVVGGSGLYIKALIEGFSPIPDIPDNVRQSVIDRQARLGNPAFYDELKKRDPVMAARLHPHHTARLVRAYEVIEATGKSLAEFQAMPKEEPPSHWHFQVTRVMPDKATLDARCNARFDWMIDHGALDEVAAFYERTDIDEQALIHRALGAAPLRAYINGDMSKDDAIARAKIDTRQYAKRQMTWFRHQIKPAPNVKIH